MTPRKPVLVLALPILALLAGVAEARPCGEIDAEARIAEAAMDLSRLAALHEEAMDPRSDCDGAFLSAFSRDVANAHVRHFSARYAEAAAEGPLAAAAAAAEGASTLEAGLAFADTWQVLLTLAEVRFEQGNADAAAPLYQRAMALMAEADADPSRPAERAQLPDAADFAALHGRMAEAALLAATYEAPPARRGTGDDGLYLESWRGYVVKSVPVPVQFTFGTAEFTEKGETAVRHLATYLVASGRKDVTLVGHTDPVGSEADNLVLSQRRAEAVRDAVIAAGYTGRVTVVGKGESEPFRRASGRALDEAARHALDRRVELLR